ncbi:MAG: MoxR family ATPase [Elusimicrobiaceae bacterium]|jgi:MoxR-like ATPase|nr:MoxR family ATPase [Elusimicrobiaceae bacterium]MBT3954720.1 MoxR family ATPase [Elusimicrobiaceae bacterium]MBT4008628.1 MoxR family ATPase [Elusimicrobiaceae bacterium]MBT4402462.1 MoxR family ATPase [Elusimicrobiaceae bacterium]MBT4439394.1 MoxR family ATPase [Elusimicrobiaceae bacterium]
MDITELNKKVKAESLFLQDLKKEIRKIIVGQEDLVDKMLTALIADGHILIEGVPGLAKTLTVSTLSQVLNSSFQRIQFTPDLIPADITGTQIFNPKDATFSARKGPIFANLILADEINRAPAKVQSALLEAMQERQVTIGDTTHQLPKMFMVMATQNPIEHEGTYPLPEAQVDRFMFKVNITYPDKEEEKQILQAVGIDSLPKISSQIKEEDILKARESAKSIYIDEKVKNYIVDLVLATRNPEKYGLQKLSSYIAFGASPRATIYLTQAAKAYAFLNGRGYVTPEDIKAIGMDVFQHRILLTYEAEAENVTAQNIVNHVFEAIDVP